LTEFDATAARARLCAAVTLAIAIASSGLRAETAEPGCSAIIVIRIADDPVSEAREQRFMDELTLVLGDVQMEVRKTEIPGYARLPLTEQLAAIEPLFARHEAAAVTWLVEMSPGRFFLCVVVWSTGRAMVRLLEAGTDVGFETDLALAAAELLGSAYLFEPPLRKDDPMRKIVEDAREKAMAMGDFAPSEPERAEGSRGVLLWATGVFESGVAGGRGPRLAAGGALSLEVPLIAGFSFRLGATLLGGSLDESPAASIDTLMISPGVGALYLRSFGRFSLGPSLDLGARWSLVAVDAAAGDSRAFRTWQFQGAVALEMRWSLVRRLSLSLALGLTGTPQQDVYRLERTGEDVLATWRLGFFARLGIGLYAKT
jgi:hypothetical protein